MTSILTNTSAMVALQTLKGINSDLNKVQDEISTGKSVGSAKDNSAVWAISKVMESDVAGFETISQSLSTGESTVAVALDASESIGDLLTKMKEKIVQAQDAANDDERAKIQADIVALRDQVESVVGAAQFNGVNLIDGSSSQDYDILSSRNRDVTGAVSSSNITVVRQDLSLSNTGGTATFGATNDATSQAFITNGAASGDGATANTVAAGGGTSDIVINTVEDGASFRLVLDDTGGANSLGQRTFEYVASSDDSANSVAANLANQISNFLSVTGETNYSIARTDNTITITNSATGQTLDVTATSNSGGTAAATTGGLGNLANIDVSTEPGATSALSAIDGLINIAIDAAAAFGTVQNQIETQSDFVSKLTDNLKAGIGTLVDADMEEASARLQALQVQQQLGVQALSIANQAPQTIMSLFK